jgi:uncharacterized protein (TIRG00374 family)
MEEVAKPEAEAAARPIRSALKTRGAWIGYIIALGCLIWVFHDVEWASLFANLPTMNWWWVALAVVSDIASYFFQGWRWSLLLRSRGRFSALNATQAIYCGLYVNEILPMRAGEVVRTYLAARWLRTGVTVIVSSIMVERFLDAVWLAFAVGTTILLVPLPRYILDAEELLAGLVFAATALFVYLVLRRKRKVPEELESARKPNRLRRILAQLAGGIRDIGLSRQLYASFAASSLVLILQILAFWLVMCGYGLQLSFWHGAAVVLIVHLGTLLPGAPSNIGTYQFFTVLGLTQFGVDKTLATGFSMVVFLILTIPLWILGFIAFGRAGMILQQILSPGDGKNEVWRRK